MSRRAHVSRAFASGSLTLAVNVAFTLLSVRLALSYLPKREFGLWALAAQVAGYLMIMDACLSASISRNLVEEKDRGGGAYGSAVKTGFIVTLLQGLCALGIGLGLSPFVGVWLDIPTDLQDEFRHVFLILCGSFAVGYTLKIFSHLLTAHQRLDLLNHGQSASLAVMLAVQWLSFRAGHGIYSLAWASIAGMLTTTALAAAGAISCKLLPERGNWGAQTWAGFRDIFVFSGNIVLITIGWQLLSATQIVIIKMHLGLEAAGVYAVCSKTFSLAQQAVWRIFDSSMPAMSEMAVRNEKERLGRRFGDMVVLSGSFGVAVAAIVALCNGAFVALWSNGKVAWPAINDWLMAGVCIAQTLNRVHGGLAYALKDVKQMRFVYFAEGIIYFILASSLAPHFGMPAILGAGIVTSFAITGAIGLMQSARSLGLSAATAVRIWLWPSLRFSLVFIPLVLAAAMLWSPQANLSSFILTAVAGGAAGLLGMWWLGLPVHLRVELSHLMGRAMARFRRR